MNFKSNNWDSIKRDKMKCFVAYVIADIELTKSGQCVYDAATTVVVIYGNDCRYVGVSQCSPLDDYSKEKGREIAAGRALKAMWRRWADDSYKPFAVEANDVRDVEVFGEVPLLVQYAYKQNHSWTGGLA
jgi:hypothetical protein